MNAIELFHKDGKPAAIFYCGQCREVRRTEADAEACCKPRRCECGAPLDAGRTACDPCWAKELGARELARFEAARHVQSWPGWIFSEGQGLSEGFFEEIEELLDWCEGEGVEPPKYAWACQSRAFARIDLDDVLERIEEDGYADFDARTCSGLPELRAALEKFNEENKGLLAYEPDYKIAVILP